MFQHRGAVFFCPYSTRKSERLQAHRARIVARALSLRRCCATVTPGPAPPRARSGSLWGSVARGLRQGQGSGVCANCTVLANTWLIPTQSARADIRVIYAPANDISGGKVLKSRTLKTRNRAGQAFRLAAASVVRADCAPGAFYRRLKDRLGPAQAIVATARLLARIVYRMLKFKIEYQAIRAEEYEQHFREREIKYLQRKAARLGLTLAPATTSA